MNKLQQGIFGFSLEASLLKENNMVSEQITVEQLIEKSIVTLPEGGSTTEGLYINLAAFPMKHEQFITNLRVHS